jgi:hypothetical protein
MRVHSDMGSTSRKAHDLVIRVARVGDILHQGVGDG